MRLRVPIALRALVSSGQVRKALLRGRREEKDWKVRSAIARVLSTQAGETTVGEALFLRLRKELVGDVRSEILQALFDSEYRLRERARTGLNVVGYRDALIAASPLLQAARHNRT